MCLVWVFLKRKQDEIHVTAIQALRIHLNSIFGAMSKPKTAEISCHVAFKQRKHVERLFTGCG